MGEQICEAFAMIGRWAVLKGADDLPGKPGLWEGVLGDFNIAINGHDEDLKSVDGLTVPPLHMLVNAPKYLAAFMLVNPSGGICAPGMEADVLDALCADIERLELANPKDTPNG